jgi:AcrR family transcriptional regulator
LDAALELFIHKGYAATRIKDIAAAADMSVGLLFHYFENKEALFLELMRLGSAAPQQMMQGFDPMQPLQFFEACATTVLGYAAESRFTARMFVLMGNAYYSEGIPAAARELAVNNDFYRQCVPLIELGQAQGSIRAGDALALSVAFWTALQGAIEVHALDPGFPLPEPQWLVDIVAAHHNAPQREM